MTEVAIKLPKEKLIEGLSSLSFKEIMDSLIQKKLFSPPSAKKYIRMPRSLHGRKNSH